MKKKSAYQKLKDRNQALTQDIYALVKGDAKTAGEVRLRWRILFEGEEMSWFGRSGSVPKGKGLWEQIKSAK